MAMKKLNIGLIMDKMFRRTFFLRPLPDRSFEAIDITGVTGNYLKDITGATSINPSCIVRVRGIKRIDYIALKLSDATTLLNPFDSQKVTVTPPNLTIPAKEYTVEHEPITQLVSEFRTYCSGCGKENLIPEHPMTVRVPDTKITVPGCEIEVPKIEIAVPTDIAMTERTFGDMLNYAESAGKMQASGNPETDKKMNYILLLGAAAVLVGVMIFFKIKSSGG